MSRNPADRDREQNWYPVSKAGWFTEHVREGIEVTRHQLELLQPARERPYLLDDATVARELNAQVLAAAAELAGGTIEATLAKTDLELGIEALIHGL